MEELTENAEEPDEEESKHSVQKLGKLQYKVRRLRLIGVPYVKTFPSGRKFCNLSLSAQIHRILCKMALVTVNISHQKNITRSYRETRIVPEMLIFFERA